jgi:hypothetical protein
VANPTLRRLTQRRGTMEAIQMRRMSFIQERRKSMRLSIASIAESDEESESSKIKNGNGILANNNITVKHNDSIVTWKD